MIAGIFHEGSGLGDQLFRYNTVRTLAEEKGYDWVFMQSSEFKGKDFMKIECSNHGSTTGEEVYTRWNEKDVRDANGLDIRSYDPEINFVEDNTIIDGSFEDDKYWGHNLENINKWLAVEPLNVPDGICVIGFRGGEYYADPNLGLEKEYYQEALGGGISKIPIPWISIYQYQVHTDDPDMASRVFAPFFAPHYLTIIPNEPISHSKHTNMGFNWRSARYAKYAIIPNSAFFILPRLLKHLEDPTAVTIAPRYWARRNTKTWARPACYYKQFTYI